MFKGTILHRVARVVAVVAQLCAAEGAATAQARPAAAIEVTDDAGHVVRLAKPARRVISLIPSATETLIALGATPQIVGRTRYDVAAEVAKLPSVGGGLDPSVETIVSLHPDLVIASESDKRQQIRQKLIAAGIAVFVLRTQDTTDIFRGMANLGRLTGRDSTARAVATSVRGELEVVRRRVAGRPTPTVFYVVYSDPPMTAGPATFIGQLLDLAGGRSIFADLRQNWPTVAMEEIVRRDPDVVIVPVGEFKANAIDGFRGLAGWRELRAVREGRVVTVPADLANRPGPGIGKAAQLLSAAIHHDFSARSKP